MRQADLDRAVARATDETIAEIRHLGFSLADPDDVTFDPEPEEAHYVDWDAVQAERCEGNTWRPRYEPAAA